MATLCAEPARNWSLKISSDSSPSNSVACSASMKSSTARSPWPGKLRKCRLQDSGVHVEHRGVRDLHQEDAVARDGADGLQVGLARQRMEAVEDEADRLVVGAAHRLPGIAVVVDVAAPGQRLEADAQAALAGALAELGKVGRGAVDAADAVRRDVGADQQQVAAQLLHQVELALRAGEGAGALVAGHALEVAERLEGDDLHAEVGHHAGARRRACR